MYNGLTKKMMYHFLKLYFAKCQAIELILFVHCTLKNRPYNRNTLKLYLKWFVEKFNLMVFVLGREKSKNNSNNSTNNNNVVSDKDTIQETELIIAITSKFRAKSEEDAIFFNKNDNMCIIINAK